MEANKHNSQGKAIALRIGGKINCNQTQTASSLETPFFVESLLSDQMDHVHSCHTLFSDKKRAYQYKTTTTLTTHSISNES